jgi:hypothetical protein
MRSSRLCVQCALELAACIRTSSRDRSMCTACRSAVRSRTSDRCPAILPATAAPYRIVSNATPCACPASAGGGDRKCLYGGLCRPLHLQTAAETFRRYPGSHAGGISGQTLGFPFRGAIVSLVGPHHKRALGSCLIREQPPASESRPKGGELFFRITGATIRRTGYTEEEDHVGQ